jgi:predicted esterase
MVLPYFGAAALREVLEGAGLDVTFAPFDGQHTIARDTVKRLAGLLAALAAP